MVAVATIGFTQSTAQHFFERLLGAGVRTVVETAAQHLAACRLCEGRRPRLVASQSRRYRLCARTVAGADGSNAESLSQRKRRLAGLRTAVPCTDAGAQDRTSFQPGSAGRGAACYARSSPRTTATAG